MDPGHPKALGESTSTAKKVDRENWILSLHAWVRPVWQVRRIGHTVRIKDCEQARGMVHAVRHLVEVQERR